MELGLSLGSQEQKTSKRRKKKINGSDAGLDLISMGLGLCCSNHDGKIQKSDENDCGEEEDGRTSEDGSEADMAEMENPLQLSLVPLGPVPRHVSSLPWSSDNGSSENGSSGNMALPAAKGVDVNKLLPPAVEEASSANSDVGSPAGFHVKLAAYGNNKRSFDGGAGNNEDEENGRSTRKKLRLSKEQSAFLEESFKEHSTLNPVSHLSGPLKIQTFLKLILNEFLLIRPRLDVSQKQKQGLAKQLNLQPRQVEVWFQNRRARTKLKQTEVDCEYLKRCCETLTEENRRLHKEVQELRALNNSTPFYAHLPPTTLTMCPSCERVAPATPSGDPKPIVGRGRSFYPFFQPPAAGP